MPEDVTGVPTYTIVRQIRCETRHAVIDAAIKWLIAEDNDDRVDPESRAIGLQFDRGRPIDEFRPELFKGRVRTIVALFFETGVAYNFELEMTETNDLGTEVNLLKPFTDSRGTLGIKAGFNRQRRNNRTFTLTDTFGGLVRLNRAYCDGRVVQASYNHVVGENYVYPIAGRIGVERLVKDFIVLTLFANLGKKDQSQGPPTLVDTLEFRTELLGSLAPKVVFAPLGTGLQVTDASMLGAAKRIDLHKITMGLAIAGPGIGMVAPLRQAIFTTPLLTARSTTSAEANAVEAVNQALTLKLFSPNIVVTP